MERCWFVLLHGLNIQEKIEMPKTIVNLTMPVIVEEIENILDSYQHHPYQEAFKIPDLYQELMAYVLSRVRSRYAVADEGLANRSRLVPLEEKLHIESVIYDGIQHVFDIIWKTDQHLSMKRHQNLSAIPMAMAIPSR
jgi:Late competence development protein ComFB